MFRHLLLAALFLAALLSLAQPLPCRADAKDDAAKAADEARLKKLLAERRDGLRHALDAAKKLFDVGNQASPETLVSVGEKLLKVELELAEKSADRIKLREDYLKTVQDMEKIANERFKVGAPGATALEYERVKDARLEAEIELLREKMKAKKADEKPADKPGK